MIGAHVVWDRRFTSYDFGLGHPMHPIRLDLTHTLSRELGLLEGEQVQVVPGEVATPEMLAGVHTAELIGTVRRFSDDPEGARGEHGVGTDDTPAFAGMHQASALAVGSTVAACRGVWDGHCAHGINVSGGLHHAMADRASGFCIYNDVAVGIRWLLEHGAQRVAYIDLDVHHGDGVERIFWDDPRVLTLSVHESGQTLFPGTGFAGDTGGPSAPDSAVNVSLPPGTGDAGWLRAIDAVLPAVVGAFAPDVVVSQHGCDTHFSDPLAHLAVSVDAMQVAGGWVHDLAHRYAGGRWVALGGGGYELVQVVPRAWAHLIGVATHRPVPLTAPVPPPWREMVQRRLGVPAPSTMGDLGGRAIAYGSWAYGFDPEDPVDRAVMATRRAVFPGWGLDPYFD